MIEGCELCVHHVAEKYPLQECKLGRTQSRPDTPVVICTALEIQNLAKLAEKALQEKTP